MKESLSPVLIHCATISSTSRQLRRRFEEIMEWTTAGWDDVDRRVGWDTDALLLVMFIPSPTPRTDVSDLLTSRADDEGLAIPSEESISKKLDDDESR